MRAWPSRSATPFAIYNRPATAFVASFVGTLNALSATVTNAAAGAVEIDGQAVTLGRPLAARQGATVTLAIRPEALALRPRLGNEAALKGQVEDVTFHGPVVRVRARIGGQQVWFDSLNTSALRPPSTGEAVEISFAPGDVLVTG